jgi:hypothetical protein
MFLLIIIQTFGTIFLAILCKKTERNGWLLVAWCPSPSTLTSPPSQCTILPYSPSMKVKVYSKPGFIFPQMEFLEISCRNDRGFFSILFTVPSTGGFYKKTLLFSGFLKSRKKIHETGKL